MRQILSTSALLCALGLAAGTAWAATDYSAMTTEELAAKRGAMQNATVEERNAFHNEWQKRIQQMQPEDRQKYMQGQGAGMGQGSGAMTEQKREEMQKRMQDRTQQRQDQGGMMGGRGGMGGGMGGMGGGGGRGR
jgi:hypothetical protein